MENEAYEAMAEDYTNQQGTDYPIGKDYQKMIRAQIKSAFIAGLSKNEGLVKAQAEYIKFLDKAYSDPFSIASIHHYREPVSRITEGIELRKNISEALSGYKGEEPEL